MSLPEQIEELKEINASLWCNFFSKTHENDARVSKLNKQLKDVQAQFERYKKKKQLPSADLKRENADLKERIANMNVEIQLLRSSIQEFHAWVIKRGENDAYEKQMLAYEASYFKNN